MMPLMFGISPGLFSRLKSLTQRKADSDIVSGTISAVFLKVRINFSGHIFMGIHNAKVLIP